MDLYDSDADSSGFSSDSSAYSRRIRDIGDDRSSLGEPIALSDFGKYGKGLDIEQADSYDSDSDYSVGLVGKSNINMDDLKDYDSDSSYDVSPNKNLHGKLNNEEFGHYIQTTTYDEYVNNEDKESVVESEYETEREVKRGPSKEEVRKVVEKELAVARGGYDVKKTTTISESIPMVNRLLVPLRTAFEKRGIKMSTKDLIKIIEKRGESKPVKPERVVKMAKASSSEEDSIDALSKAIGGMKIAQTPEPKIKSKKAGVESEYELESESDGGRDRVFGLKPTETEKIGDLTIKRVLKNIKLFWNGKAITSKSGITAEEIKDIYSFLDTTSVDKTKKNKIKQLINRVLRSIKKQ